MRVDISLLILPISATFLSVLIAYVFCNYIMREGWGFLDDQEALCNELADEM